jgi:16S rRNA (cytidine1402-2'-O)-methyltransferase
MYQQMKGKLYLIPTPLAENTIEAMLTPVMRQILMELDYFLVENIRTARRFVSSLKLGISIESLGFHVLDKNSAQKEVELLCAPLQAGKSIGIMSEAGCPGIADPGNLAVKYAHNHEIEVIPLAGPSSIFMALMASGFNGQSFAFHGYLPIDKTKRQQKSGSWSRRCIRRSRRKYSWKLRTAMNSYFRISYNAAGRLRGCVWAGMFPVLSR